MSQLQLKTEYSGEGARITCSGRIVAGIESEELDRALRELFMEVKNVELDMERVILLDSSGIGVLVRQLVRSKGEGKQLRVAACSPQVRKTLELTNVLAEFQAGAGEKKRLPEGLRLLFVHPSAEIRTFISALLNDRGAEVSTCASVYDARTLATSGDFRLIIVPAELDSSGLPTSRTIALERHFFEGAAEDVADELITGLSSILQASAAGV